MSKKKFKGLSKMKNKEKYDLSKLKLDSISHDGKIKRMMVYKKTSSDIKKLFEKQYTQHVYPYELLVDFANWLEEEYDPKILDDVEKAYLSAVIKPFRKRIKRIEKISNNFICGKQFLCVELTTGNLTFPVFEKGTMYKGMEANKRYTLEELGL